MATGTELILGIPFGKWGYIPNETIRNLQTRAIAEHLVVRPTERDSEPEWPTNEEMTTIEEYTASYDELLARVHREALEAKGFTFSKDRKIGRYTWSIYRTSLGPREFNPFSLALHLDRDEMGEGPTSAVIGVSITGRYHPTFADWRNPHRTLYPIIFNDELTADMVGAKRYITYAVPWLEHGVWIVKEKFY